MIERELEDAIPAELFPPTIDALVRQGSMSMQFTTADGLGTVRVRWSAMARPPVIVVADPFDRRAEAPCSGERAEALLVAMELSDKIAVPARAPKVVAGAMTRLYELMVRIATDPAGPEEAMRAAIGWAWDQAPPPSWWDCECVRLPDWQSPDEVVGLRRAWAMLASVPWLDPEPASIEQGDMLEVHDARFRCRAVIRVLGAVDDPRWSDRFRREMEARAKDYRRRRNDDSSPLIVGWIGPTRQVVARAALRKSRL